ncbi:MAG: hypothetical protein V4622_13240 [Bacteroidota bacterium]
MLNSKLYKSFGLKLSFFLLLCLSFQVEIFSQEVNLEVSGNREIEPAYRITKQPKLIDTIIPYSEIQYPLLSLKYETTFALDTIKSAKIKLIDKLADLYPCYAKLGVGSKFMPMAEFYFNSLRSRKSVYGIHLKHLSSVSAIKGFAPSQFDKTNLSLFGTLNEKKYSLDGAMHFSSFGLHQYGLRNENTPKDSIAQRFSDFGTSFTYTKHKHDTLSFNYLVNLKYNYFQDKNSKVDSLQNWFGRENYVNLNSRAWYKFGKEIISADASLALNAFKYGLPNDSLSAFDKGFVNTNLIFNLAPNITTFAKNNRLKIKFGVNFALDILNDNIQPKTKVFLYPDIELKYSFFDDILIPYLEVKGGLKQNTFKSLSQENEFLLSNVYLQNENNNVNGKIGLKGTLSNTLMFNTSASFGIYKNKALFVNDTLISGGNQFAVIYDEINVATIQASLIYQVAEKLKIEGIGIFNSYQAKNNIYAWNLPQIQVIARTSYKVMEKLTVKFDLNLEGGRFAKVYTKADSDFEENQQFAKKLGFIPDFNLSGEYHYNQKLSAFLQFNNFVAQRYNRWYNYPVQGFQVLGGVSFRF